MVEPALYVALGFFVAVVLALIVAPSIWRRAVTVTRRRVEASLPLTLDEIEAGKDRIRAESAVAVRRLEMAVANAVEKANAQLIKTGRAREEIKLVEAQHETTRQNLTDEIARAGELRNRISGQELDLAERAQAILGRDRLLAEREEELARLGEQYQEAAYTSGIRQIELTARENDIQTLRQQLDKAAKDYAGLEQKLAEQRHRAGMAREAANAERKRSKERDEKLSLSVSLLAEHDETLARAARDAEMLRAALQDATGNAEKYGLQLAAAQQQIGLLEGQVAAERETARTERKRAEDRDKRLARSLESVSDRDEALSRTEKEAATLLASLESTAQTAERYGSQLVAAQEHIRALEARIAASERQRPLWPDGRAETMSDEAAKFAGDRRRLEDRLKIIATQNQKLRAELAALQAPLTTSVASGDQDSLLREQISAIAAQVVHLAHVLEGPGSQIDRALSLPAPGTPPSSAGENTKIISLADRIRSLRT